MEERSTGVGIVEEGLADDRGSVEAVFRIPDMDCPSCVQRIQTSVQGVRGVTDFFGNPLTRKVRVRFDPRLVDPAGIQERIGRVGYTARAESEADDTAGRISAWLRPDAVRTYLSGALFGAGLVSMAVGWPAAPPFVVAAVVGGWNFFPKGLRAARTLSLDMNFLMTGAILGAVGIGEYQEAAAIAFLFSLAELLERFSVDRARHSIESLLDLSPKGATVLENGREVTRPVEEVVPGDRVVVRPGERIPVDGVVTEGASGVDQSSVTGESMPVDRTVGDEVFAGTVNGEGHLILRVERAGEDTTLARMIHLVEEAEGRKSGSERFVERFARWYTPTVTVAALLVATTPPLLFGAPFTEWFVRGLTLLVIACPCALVISTPVAVVSGVTAAARNGVLIKGGVHLETMGDVQVVAFDKTGTLTPGCPAVVAVVPAPGSGVTEEAVLGMAAALERHSEHALGRAIVRSAEERGVSWSSLTVQDFVSVPGRGVRARLDGDDFVVGRLDMFATAGGLETELHRLRSDGRTVVAVGPPSRPLGLVALADRPREGARRAVAALRRAGVERIVMLTGDNAETARAVGREVGVDDVRADLMPEDKVRIVEELEARFGRVAMVGDGVNDAPALAVASVGIAMGAAGSDTALETADVALMGDDLSKLAYLYRLSHRGRRVIRQNIGASIALKAVLAVGVPFGLVSLIAAVVVGDMGASLAVTGNSLRLARVRP